MDERTAWLRARWPLAEGLALADDVIAAYATPSRRYHNIEHLQDVLTRIAELAHHDAGFDRLAVTLAAWFHDVVYDGRPDDEERSAAYAEGALAGLVTRQTLTEVARLVRLTATHRPDPDDENGAALCDADLAILAAPSDRYGTYTSSVRAEYSHVAEHDFRAGRARILRALLEKPRLFHTRHAQDQWELAARTNLERELAGLTS